MNKSIFLTNKDSSSVIIILRLSCSAMVDRMFSETRPRQSVDFSVAEAWNVPSVWGAQGMQPILNLGHYTSDKDIFESL